MNKFEKGGLIQPESFNCRHVVIPLTEDDINQSYEQEVDELIKMEETLKQFKEILND